MRRKLEETQKASSSWESNSRVGAIWLSWLNGRVLAAQDRGVLGLTHSDCWPFRYFCLITVTMLIL